METQRLEIERTVSDHGWKIERIEQQSEWWADEMWLVESTRSPIGANAYITFLVDPQNDDPHRAKGNDVWAVMATSTRPSSWMEGPHLLQLGSGWKANLPAFLDSLETLRKQI